MQRPLRRVVLAALAATTALTGALTGAPPAAASPSPAPRGPVVPGDASASHTADPGRPAEAAASGGAPAAPRWGDCARGPADTRGARLDDAGMRCAEVTVPVDHTDPAGPTLTVAVSRLPATAPDGGEGPLLINGGGPGGRGLHLPLDAAAALGDVAGRYDLIGMDPRGIGRSTPVDCGWPTGSSIRSAGTGLLDFLAASAVQRDLAEDCRTNGGPLLPHLTTRQTARDIDRVRAALGAEQLHYLGYSYGTYLGQVYGQLFPDRLGRTVLDGVMDPARYGAHPLADTTAANEAALRDWAVWTAARHGTYGLGRDADAVLGEVERVVRAATARPLRVGDHHLDHRAAPVLYLIALGTDRDTARDGLARDTQLLSRAADGEPVVPHESLDRRLRLLLTDDHSAFGSAQTAVLCGDAVDRRTTLARYLALRAESARHPLAGPVAFNTTPCAHWPEPREPLTVVDDDRPVLLVASTGDPRTSYDHARAVRDRRPGARLITLEDSTQHAVFGVLGNRCVDDAVTAYLATGRLPDTDVRCARE
ncbi:alpha/beta hydrolase [Streptomyces spiramenti]|uniref:Alpha/beta hydrolase n=1 Tax=Streptomyces spiramenti TaxID=2720606 RepID=A0ABX1AI26_9ACTN|nr:alpha/beta hydrolase [Streptomyces spiramenti]NJP65860.1 alpha/beta hydrolase [Streptomyces spiramenti]